MTHAIIIEDDPMVAQINRQYIQQMKDFRVDAIFENGKEARIGDFTIGFFMELAKKEKGINFRTLLIA